MSINIGFGVNTISVTSNPMLCRFWSKSCYYISRRGGKVHRHDFEDDFKVINKQLNLPKNKISESNAQ